MADNRITAEQLQAELQADVKLLAEQMAAALNNAHAGRIIADTEEQVRDAHAVFRQKAYQRALDLLQSQALQEDFSPSPHKPATGVEE
jgi:TolA-binding protein